MIPGPRREKPPGERPLRLLRRRSPGRGGKPVAGLRPLGSLDDVYRWRQRCGRIPVFLPQVRSSGRLPDRDLPQRQRLRVASGGQHGPGDHRPVLDIGSRFFQIATSTSTGLAPSVPGPVEGDEIVGAAFSASALFFAFWMYEPFRNWRWSPITRARGTAHHATQSDSSPRKCQASFTRGGSAIRMPGSRSNITRSAACISRRASGAPTQA